MSADKLDGIAQRLHIAGGISSRLKLETIRAALDEAVAEAASAMRQMVAGHCSNEKLFCGSCADARRWLATLDARSKP